MFVLPATSPPAVITVTPYVLTAPVPGAPRSTGVTAAATYPWLAPSDLWALYGEPLSDGLPVVAGTPLVAVVESGSYGGQVQSDLARYRSSWGLPACGEGCLTEVSEHGPGARLPAPDPAADGSGGQAWLDEADLDVQTISGVCPSCRILMVDADSSAAGDMLDAVQEAVRLGARWVSMSFGGSDTPSLERAHPGLFTTPGVVFTAATGDSGFDGVAPWPASEAGVVAVGGTSLAAGLTAWSGAASGCSPTASAPAVQQAVRAIAATCGGAKAAADLSAVADPHTGLYGYVAGQAMLLGGTSLAAPEIAALYAVAGNHDDPGVIYSHPDLFTDVTTGSTLGCSLGAVLSALGAGGLLDICQAGPGWDGPTGLGQPASIAAFVDDQEDVAPPTVSKPGATLRALLGPRVSGRRHAGGRLVAHPPSLASTPAGIRWSYQWLRDGRPLRGARAAAYRLPRRSRGHRYAVVVTAEASGQTTSWRSAALRIR